MLGAHFKRKPRMTLNAALGKYWQEHGKDRKSAYSTIKLHSRHLLGHFGESIYMDEIDDAQVNDYVASQKDTITCRKTPVTNATINRRVEFLRTLLRRAAKKWKVETPEIDFKEHLLDEPKARTRWITAEEGSRLIGCAVNHLKGPILFALLTGARLSTITKLQWRDVIFGKGLVTLQGVKSILPDGTEGNELEIPISGALKALLLEQGLKTSGYVFLRHFKLNRKTKKQRKPEPIIKFRRSFATACKKAGIENFRFHDQRHTAASWMIQNGVPLDVVQAMLGHSDISQTQKYAHREKSAMMEAAETLASHIRHNEKKEQAA